MPSLMGLDSDSPRSLGEVGREGVAVDTLDDMEDLFAGIDLSEVSVSMTINAPAAIMLAFYVVAAERKGIGPEQLAGTIQTDILKEYIAQKEWCFPVDPAMRLVTDMVEYCSTDMPRWHPISISGYHIREAGSTAAQELAFTLKDGLTYVEQAVERGLDVDDFAPRLSFFFNAHIDFFEEIAKYRAARRIWARELRETFGAKNPKSWLMRFHTQTAGVSLTAQQPLNNIVRTAIEALAGVLGGTQSLHTNSYDEALALPTENAVRIALRTQQIIARETGVTNTIDPLGGSYFVEELTDELERQAYGYFAKIDELGGMVEAVKTGYPQREIADAAFTFQTELDDGKRSMVGVTELTEGNELDDTELLHMDPASEGKQTDARGLGTGGPRRRPRAGHAGRPARAGRPRGREPDARAAGLRPRALHRGRDRGEPPAGLGLVPRDADVLGGAVVWTRPTVAGRSAPTGQSTGPPSAGASPAGAPAPPGRPGRRPAAPRRSMPVSWPISCSIETRSSLATLPVAPAGTGQPPSSPKEDSNERTPASRAASALARPWPRVLWKWAVSSTPGRRSKARREELAHLGRVGHAGGVAEADLGHAGGRQAVGDGEHRLGLDTALVGAAERHRDHGGARAGPRPARARSRAPARPATPRPTGSRWPGCGDSVADRNRLASWKCSRRASALSSPRSLGTSTATSTSSGTSMAAQHLGGVGQLGDHVGADEAGDLEPAQAGAGQLVDQRDLGRGGDDLGLVLEPVARADLADGDGVGHALRIWPRKRNGRPRLGTGRLVPTGGRLRETPVPENPSRVPLCPAYRRYPPRT